MKKILLVLGILLGMLIVPMALADDPAYVFDDEGDIDLKINCFNEDNSICNATTICTATINYPDTSLMVSNATMTYNSNYYNYTITNNRIKNKLGEYPTMIHCSDGNEDAFDTFLFEVNSGGSRYSAYIIPSIILLFIYLLIILSFWMQEQTLGILAAMAMLVIGVYMHIKGFGDIKNFMTDAFSLIHIAIGAYILIKVTGEEAVNQLGG